MSGPCPQGLPYDGVVILEMKGSRNTKACPGSQAEGVGAAVISSAIK